VGVPAPVAVLIDSREIGPRECGAKVAVQRQSAGRCCIKVTTRTLNDCYVTSARVSQAVQKPQQPNCTAAIARYSGATLSPGQPREMEQDPMQVRVLVRLKPGVLDPQGRAVHHALEGMGFGGVNDVRIGRLIELDVADGTDHAAITAMCEKLLANTVIESFTIEGSGVIDGGTY
jgi:phosphoribosylformylglycinamidine synthase